MLKGVSGALVGLGVIGFLVMMVVFAQDYGAAPNTVPTHFGPSGEPDAWGPKSTFVIFPVNGIVLLGLAAAIATFGLPSRKRPVPPILPVLTCAVFVELIWVLLFTEMGSFAVALRQTTELNATVMWVGLSAVMLTTASLVAVAVVYAVRSRV